VKEKYRILVDSSVFFAAFLRFGPVFEVIRFILEDPRFVLIRCEGIDRETRRKIRDRIPGALEEWDKFIALTDAWIGSKVEYYTDRQLEEFGLKGYIDIRHRDPDDQFVVDYAVMVEPFLLLTVDKDLLEEKRITEELPVATPTDFKRIFF